ncbi:MAG: lipopolysaccharide biosynthesis protein [Candidatus Melainabacteria bacterium]|nr:lipopolysaccharide biosynthesis protein [Candidatus Melainabacteria bacterium]
MNLAFTQLALSDSLSPPSRMLQTASPKSPPVADAHFSTEHLSADIGGRTVRAGTVTVLSQGIKLLLQIGSMVLLARLLTPEDYGLFGIVTAVTALGLIIKDMGLAAATLNSATLNHQQVSNLFWITAGRNVALAAVTCVVAPFVAQFYHDSRLTPLLVAMSLTFVVLALSSQHQALLRRQMRFQSLALIDLVSLALGIGAAIVCASAGAQVWSLVVMQIAIAIGTTVGSWLACSWRPGLLNRRASTRSLLQFGQQIVAFQVLDYFVRNVDNLLIGRWCGAGTLGLYDRAFQLHMIPAQNICWPIGAVVLGTLSRVRSDTVRFNKCAVLTIYSASAICMPIIAFLFVTAHEAVSLLLGPHWFGSVDIFRALAPAAFFESIVLSLGWIFAASNQGARLLKCCLVQTIASVAGFFIGVRWGAVGVALALSVTRSIMLLPTIFYCSKNTDIKTLDLAKAPVAPMIASLVAAAISYLCGKNVHLSALRFIGDGILFASTYVCILMCFSRTREVAALIFSAAKNAVRTQQVSL